MLPDTTSSYDSDHYNSLSPFLSVLTAIFSAEPGLDCFIGAKDDRGGEW